MQRGIGLGIVIPLALFAHVATTSVARASEPSVREPIAPVFDDVDHQSDAERTYTVNAYSIVHVGRTSQVNEEGSSWRPNRGLVMRLSVEYDEFFESLGRRDLAKQFASRQLTWRILVGGGTFIQFASVIVIVVGVAKDSLVIGAVGGGMLLGGIVMRGIGSDMDKPTFPEDRAIDMASRYNEALRKHLGLPSLPDPPAPKGVASNDGTLIVVPALGDGGLGLVLAGRF